MACGCQHPADCPAVGFVSCVYPRAGQCITPTRDPGCETGAADPGAGTAPHHTPAQDHGGRTPGPSRLQGHGPRFLERPALMATTQPRPSVKIVWSANHQPCLAFPAAPAMQLPASVPLSVVGCGNGSEPQAPPPTSRETPREPGLLRQEACVSVSRVFLSATAFKKMNVNEPAYQRKTGLGRALPAALGPMGTRLWLEPRWAKG